MLLSHPQLYANDRCEKTSGALHLTCGGFRQHAREGAVIITTTVSIIHCYCQNASITIDNQEIKPVLVLPIEVAGKRRRRCKPILIPMNK